MEVLSGVEHITWVLYLAGISWKTCLDIVNELIELGLVEQMPVGNNGRRRYRYGLTAEGRKVLEMWKSLTKLMRWKDKWSSTRERILSR